MALFATENWTMRHRLLLTIGAILVVCQLISVFWLWHESKEQIQLLVASAIEGHNNQKHVEHEVREAVASLLVPSLLIVGLALYISLLAVKQITKQIQVIILFEIHFFQQFHEPPAVVMYISNNIVHPKSPFLSQLSCQLLQSSKLSLSAHFFQNGFPACVLACPVSKIFPLVLLVPNPGLLILASWNV